jgi:hypothetical protein
MKKIFKSFSLIINYKTFIITALAVISSYLCYHLGLTAKFPDMLVGADFKGHAIALYYATRDWSADKNNDLPDQAKQIIIEMMRLMRDMFKTNHHPLWIENETKIYQLFSRLSGLTMEMRKYGVQSGEISRVSQYVSKIIIAFDNMKIIHNYRTPITLRTYSKVFIYIFPIIYGPYFASTFNDYSASLEYVMPILYSFILVSLDNIQDHLENPFDDVGEDDIVIDAEETAKLLS